MFCISGTTLSFSEYYELTIPSCSQLRAPPRAVETRNVTAGGRTWSKIPSMNPSPDVFCYLVVPVVLVVNVEENE